MSAGSEESSSHGNEDGEEHENEHEQIPYKRTFSFRMVPPVRGHAKTGALIWDLVILAWLKHAIH